MSATPRTDENAIAVAKVLWESENCPSELVDADFARELERELTKARAWIDSLDILAENNSDDREWHGGEIGWVYPGDAAYYGKKKQ